MSTSTSSMMGEPVSAEEAQRRRAMLAAFNASQILPPLYRLSTMDRDVTWGTAGEGSEPTRSQSRFIREVGATSFPRLEVHMLEFGAIDNIAELVWAFHFGKPLVLAEPSTIPVTIAGSSHEGRVLAMQSDGWMVSFDAPPSGGTFLVVGPGDLPEFLSLEPVLSADLN